MGFCELWKTIDFFGKVPEFYLKGKPKLVSWFGRIFTYIFIILYIIIFCYKLIRMYQRVDITFYDSYSNTDEIPEIRLTKDNFSVVFAVFDRNGNPYINERIYYPVAYFNGEERQNINIEICDPNKINNKYKQYLKDYNINHFYCLTDIDYTFKPYINSLIVEIYPCKNDADNTNQCDSKTNIDESLDDHVFMVYFEDIILTPLNYDEPIKERINYLSTDIYKNLGQYLYTELQLVKIETSTNIIGFEFLSEPRVEEFIKFDKELSYSYPGYNLDDEENDSPVNVFEIQLNDKILLEKRQYIKLIDVLGEIGGLMEMIYSLFSLICTLVIDKLYERKITNNLFSFNIEKKLILINEGKDFVIKFNNNKITEDENIAKNITKNITENKLFTKNKKKKIIQRKGKSKEDLMIIRKNNKYINNKLLKNKNSVNNLLTYELTEKKLKEENNDKINSEVLYNASTIAKNDEDNNRIITKINLKDLLLASCYCGKQKRKKIYRILVDEIMNIISNTLDIINIFRKIYSTEHSNNDLNLNKNQDTIQMSKKCINDLSEILG